MSTDGVDPRRRRILVAAAAVVGGVGTVFTLVPFVKSMNPSAKAQAAGAPVEVDISKLEPGQKINVEWRGKPVWVVKRTPEMLEALPGLDATLADPASEVPQQPDYAKNPARSIKPEILVLIGICTHLGCSPTYRPEIAPEDMGRTGRAVSSAPATVRNSIWPAASTAVSLRRPTCTCRRTATWVNRSS
jgi:ubiquinol-cytochrome c reductase iron-sulfur subunit